jgi:hypothetical protein
MRTSIFLLATASMLTGAGIERRGSALWPNANHYRVVHTAEADVGTPLAVDFSTGIDFNPDSVRVVASGGVVPAKTEWRRPSVRVSFLSTGDSRYEVYFDAGRNGETERLVAPAMIGTGDRMTYGRAGVRGRVAVGLWPHPSAFDFDDDGDIDLVIGCADRPYNGTYLFRNIGSNDKPLYDIAEWFGPGPRELVAADFNGDEAIDLVVKGGYYSDVKRNRMSRFVKIALRRDYHVGRDDQWYPVDWDGDGLIDVLAGVSDWRDYGWDDAYSGKGEWTRGPLHGYVYFHRNVGTNASPRYGEPVQLQAGGKMLDLYGSPAPSPVDWSGRGVLDLIGGSFLDTVTLFRRTESGLAAGEPVRAGGEILKMDLCMIQPRIVSWHKDGRPSLLISEEDGTVALVENMAPRGREPELAAPKYLEQVDPYLKSGVLSRPVAVDWNGDGKLDIVAGNSAGYLQFFENVGTAAAPAFADRGYLRAAGEVIRVTAGRTDPCRDRRRRSGDTRTRASPIGIWTARPTSSSMIYGARWSGIGTSGLAGRRNSHAPSPFRSSGQELRRSPIGCGGSRKAIDSLPSGEPRRRSSIGTATGSRTW